ncbi:sensor domain-containing protein [Sulfurimonas sp.]|uniref:sensor domain-containing protein n=1 Tax=Sulfurimonas sp. TaxID=2022749 RepID=UPI003D0B39DF
MKRIASINPITIFLVLFITLLISLFYYLYQIEQSVEKYHENHDKLIALRFLDKGFNDFALASNELSNYNNLNHDIETFRITLSELYEALLIDYKDVPSLKNDLNNIHIVFSAKVEELEYFKSLNSTLIGGSHFLFDLQRSISEDKNISSDMKSLVNETLFYLFQSSQSAYIDKSFIVQKLEKIKKLNQKRHTVLIENFYEQSEILLDTLSAYRNTASTVRKSSLEKRLSHLHDKLDIRFQKYLLEQQFIATFFFVSTIFTLIIFMLLYLKTLKNQKELFAFKYAVQHGDNSIVITDPEKNIIFVNEVFEKTTGYSKSEALGKNPRILKSDLQEPQTYAEMHERLEQGKSWEGELINKRKDGSLFYERASIIPIFLNKKLINYIAIKLDITQYIEQNKVLRQAASVYDNTEEAIIIADVEGNVVSVNKAFSEIYGYTIDDLFGKNLSTLHSGKQDQNFYKHMWDEIIHNDVYKGKITNKTKDGQEIPVWVTIKAVKDKNNQVVNYTAVQTDLRAIEKSEAKADYLAYHDPLTGLYNRVSFEEFLAHTLLIAKRAQKQFAVLFIDLDRFKVINDTLGHDIGDKVLVSVTERLKNILRESDFISRWGGDEFVVILNDVISESLVATVARKIIEGLKEPIYVEHHHFIITASIGISMYPINGSDTKTLIKYADSAMYQAKDRGKNNFYFYTQQFSLETEEKLNLDIALHSALEKNEFYMVFQPQYRLEDKKVVSVEALVRWENETFGLVPPDKFIPIAEDNGYIIDLGYFIFEESCKKFKEMKDAGIALQWVAINVSSIQFKEVNLLEALVSTVKRYNMKPSEVEIEITERFLMDNTEANIRKLQEFREYGFKISIDDFGTGYSSMSYLKQLPIDTIKIDKSFIEDINDGSSDNAIIEAIIALSKTLGYSIVAEGIETTDQEYFLKQHKCDLGQGYLFSKPKMSDEIIQQFRNGVE